MTKTTVNRQVQLSRFVGADEVVSADHFNVVDTPMPLAGDQQILVKVLLLGTSPAQRMYITEERKFHFAVEIGDVMSGRGVAEVIVSNHPDYSVGEIIQANTYWQDYIVLTPDDKTDPKGNVNTIQKVPNPVRPLTSVLGAFGQLAFTALCGIVDVCDTKEGDVVVITAAAGGVGSMAGQIAKIKGAKKVIGVASTRKKCDWLVNEVGFDAAISYKEEDIGEALDRECPDGIDVALDSVGTYQLDAILKRIRKNARVGVVGWITGEYQDAPPPGPAHYYNLIYQRAKMEGYVVWDHVARFPEMEAQMRDWYKAGKIKILDDISDGLESAPSALGSLFTGGNMGGCIIRVADDPEHVPQL